MSRMHSSALGSICASMLFLMINAPTWAQVQPTISTASSSNSNSYISPQTVSMSTSSGTIYYTLNGATPTNADTQYISPIPISQSTQIKAVSYLSGSYSPVTTVFLDVDPTLAPILLPGLSLRLRSDFGLVSSTGSPAPVDTWVDLSGNNNDATGSGASRPVLDLNSINALPSVKFNGSSQYLTLPTGFADFTQNLVRIGNAPPYQASTQRIIINGNNADYSSTTSDTNASIASGLAAAINALSISGVSASATSDTITISAPYTTTISTVPADKVSLLSEGPGATLFVLTKPTALTANARILDIGQAGSGNNVICQIANTGSKGQLSVYSGTSGSDAQSAVALGSDVFQVLTGAQAAGSSNGAATFYINAYPGTTNTSMNNIANTSRTNNYIGQASSGGNFYAGKITDILLYTNKLSSIQMNGIIAYLSQRAQISYQTAIAPVFSQSPGTLTAPAQVSIKTEPGAQTFITRDNSTPSSSSQPYNGEPITINYTQTIKAISILNGVQSPISTANYVLDSSLWPAPNPADMAAPTINLELPTPSI